MSIQETVIVELAEVDVNDDYRVELSQIHRVVDYSPSQARDLANELVNAADKAEETFNEDLAERGARMEAAMLRHVTGEVVL